MKFVRPDGKDISLDDMCNVHCVDSGGDLIAICHVSQDGKKIEEEEIVEELESLGFTDKIRANPFDWDTWEIVINTSFDEVLLQRAIASAWNIFSLVERMAYKEPEEDEEPNHE